jgi:hypothetical protein
LFHAAESKTVKCVAGEKISRDLAALTLGANLVLNKSVIPLTPRFSAVESEPQPTKPFQRFIAAIPIKPGSR